MEARREGVWTGGSDRGKERGSACSGKRESRREGGRGGGREGGLEGWRAGGRGREGGRGKNRGGGSSAWPQRRAHRYRPYTLDRTLRHRAEKERKEFNTGEFGGEACGSRERKWKDREEDRKWDMAKETPIPTQRDPSFAHSSSRRGASALGVRGHGVQQRMGGCQQVLPQQQE